MRAWLYGLSFVLSLSPTGLRLGLGYRLAISFGNQQEVLLRHGRCARFARPTADTTSPWPMMLPYDPSLSSHLTFYRPPKPQTPPTPFPSLPLSAEERRATNVRFSFENRKANTAKQQQAKLTVLPLVSISRLPLWNPYLLFFVVIAREPKMLDRFRRGTSKQQSNFTFASSPLRC